MLEMPADPFAWSSAAEISTAVADGRTSAVEVAEAAIARIGDRDPLLNAVTAMTEQRALNRARAARSLR